MIESVGVAVRDGPPSWAATVHVEPGYDPVGVAPGLDKSSKLGDVDVGRHFTVEKMSIGSKEKID